MAISNFFFFFSCGVPEQGVFFSGLKDNLSSFPCLLSLFLSFGYAFRGLHVCLFVGVCFFVQWLE